MKCVLLHASPQAMGNDLGRRMLNGVNARHTKLSDEEAHHLGRGERPVHVQHGVDAAGSKHTTNSSYEFNKKVLGCHELVPKFNCIQIELR